MKIKKFNGIGIHGYLDISLNFRPDYTFLIGLNGSGKTSALRIIMSLLTPDWADLVSLAFHTAIIEIEEEAGAVRVIRAERTSEVLTVHVQGVEEILTLTAAEQALLTQPRSPDEISPVLLKA